MSGRSDPRYRILFGAACGVALLDQLVKAWVTAVLPLYGSVSVVPGFFDLVNIRNRGAAFGFLNRSDIEWQFWLFLAAAVLAGGVILWLTRAAERGSHLFVAGMGLILGGAAGNLLDRIRFRAVVDFLDFHVAGWHWPAFNVADIAICCGAFLACFTVLWSERRARKSAVSAGKTGEAAHNAGGKRA